jgi:teichuronic acid biosynthesis glycosyltransferase TuaC
MAEIKVLSLSTNYPRPTEKGRGLFVRSRLQHLGKLLPVRVVSPVAWIDYAAKEVMGGYPSPRLKDGSVEVFYPRWFYPPHGGVVNAWFLAARMLPFLRRVRQEFPFSVIDAHFGHPEGVAAALIATVTGVPFTVTLRGSEVLHAASRGRRRWMGWALRRAARVITVAESLRRFAIGLGVDPERVRTIPNGVDADVFHPRPRASVREKLQTPADRPVILTAGHLIELKGHHRAVRALAELHRKGRVAELWIAGGAGRAASFEKEILREVRDHGLEESVRFLGALSQEELAAHMSAADVFCLASSREGWPNVVHEALACGTPVVATNVGGVEDMLPAREYGIVVPPADQAELTAALGCAVGQPWNREAIAAWGRSRSWTTVAAETADILAEAAVPAAVERSSTRTVC